MVGMLILSTMIMGMLHISKIGVRNGLFRLLIKVSLALVVSKLPGFLILIHNVVWLKWYCPPAAWGIDYVGRYS